jgi:RimJ/RimL family protein N-acetyltransferase
MTTLEPLLPDQFELVARWLSKPAINRWLTPDWRNKEASSSMLAIASRNRRNRLFLVRYNQEPCGLAALADIETADRTAMVWYLLGEETLAGRGITSAAVRQLARIAFEELELASIYAWTMDDNVASQRVLGHAGFQIAGCLRNSVRSEERQLNRIYFDLIPGEIPAEADPAR